MFFYFRTHTLILVDDKNRITYREKTMKCPINEENPPEWIDKTYEFQGDQISEVEMIQAKI
jgi:hypothetical protein